MNTARAIPMAALITLLTSGLAHATPSTTYWTPCTEDIQPFGVLHIGVDNYFNGSEAFPTDAGLTMGVLPFEKLQAEVGIDLLEPYDYPIFFNAKLGLPENAFLGWSPALEVGIFNIGIEPGVTTQNIVYGVIGKTIPFIGRLAIGPYIGNGGVLVDKDGNAANVGFMAAWDRGFLPAKNAAGEEYNRLVVAGDYAYGNNAIGGGGAGVYYFFTKNISLLTGPVWFNDAEINGEWKWTIQLDINARLFQWPRPVAPGPADASPAP